jgi:hypothetical protein
MISPVWLISKVACHHIFDNAGERRRDGTACSRTTVPMSSPLAARAWTEMLVSDKACRPRLYPVGTRGESVTVLLQIGMLRLW